MRATRIMVNLRPKMKAISEAHAKRTDADADKEQRQALKALYKEYDFSPSSGCFPALIQIPVFLGLYQLLLHMARPTEGIDATVIHPIGFLSSDEVRSFLKVRIWDIPVPAYVSMSPEQLEELGTNRDDVFWFVLPLVVIATVFTVGNMAYSIWRSYLTLDHENRVAIRMNRFIMFMVLMMPFMLITAAMYSPVPSAIVVYWVANNLWTLSQIVIISVMLDRKHPLTDEFENFQDEAFERRLEKESELKHNKEEIRKHRVLMFLEPHKLPAHRAEIKRIKEEMRSKKLAERQEKRDIRRQRSEAKKERREQLKAEKEAAQQDVSGSEQPNDSQPSGDIQP